MIDLIYPHKEYKSVPSRWISRVPSHWHVRKLRTLLTPRSARNRPELPLLSVAREKGVFVRSADDDNHNVIPEDLTNYKVAQAGNLVINKMKAWQGSMGVAPCDGIVSPAYYVYDLRLDNMAFAQALLRSRPYVAHFAHASDGVRVGQWDLAIARMREIPVLIPPHDEQAAIVRFLDHANRRIERYIRGKRKLIALLNEQKQAIIHRAVTRGLDPNVPMKDSGVPWLGEIPAHWEIRRAKQLCLAIVDCKNRTPDFVENGAFTVVRTTNIRNGCFRIEGSYRTDQRNFEIWTQRGAPRVGDVFFTREAPAGEAALVPEMAGLCMGQRMMYMRPDTRVLDPRYLLHSIYGPVVRTYIDLACNGSTVGHLRLGQIGSLPLLWCPADEQRRIVEHIECTSAPLLTGIAQAEREIALMREYRTRLVADVVTGQLDVREAARNLPNVEPEPSAIEDNADEVDSLDDELDGDEAA